jgi:transposase
VGALAVAAHQKKVRELHATLGFTDESGFLLAPLARRSQAPRGRTPVMRVRARRRDKVSVAAALTLSPVRGHVSLRYQTYPDQYVDSELYAHFMRNLLWHVPGEMVLLHDGGNMHKGPAVRAVTAEFPRLHLYRLPPYAPELNPPEYLWTYEKYHRLANFVPLDVPQIDATVCAELEDVRHDQPRLKSLFASSPLPWNDTTLVF